MEPLPDSAGAFVALKTCGCLVYAACDDRPGDRASIGNEMARCITFGARPAYWTIEQVRQSFWSCDVCQPLPEPVMMLDTQTEQRWKLSGTLTLSVKLRMDTLVMQSPEDNDQLREDLIEAVCVSSPYLEDENISVDWEDDAIIVTKLSTADEAALDKRQLRLPIEE